MQDSHVKIAIAQLEYGVEAICESRLSKKNKDALRDMALKLYATSGGIPFGAVDNVETLLQYTSEAIVELAKQKPENLNNAGMQLSGKPITAPELIRHMASQLNRLAFHLDQHVKAMCTKD